MTIAPAHDHPHTPGHGYSVQDLRDLILWHVDERAIWEAREAAAYRRGVADTLARQGITPADVKDAYAAGQRDAHPDWPGWDAGWEACYRRIGAEIGTRARPRRRGSGRARPADLRRAAQRWEAERPDRQARIRASWGLPPVQP